MLESIRTTIITKCILVNDRPILAAVSGGPDSLFLLDVLRRLDLPIIVAHFNHGLRKESDAEAENVRKIAEEMNLRYVYGQDDVEKFAEINVISLEEAARISRYRFLFRQAESHRAQAVAVGHTADDQVETVLMHLLRGAGMSGLKGMLFRSLPNSWSRSIPLVRPLLNIWREEILDYLADNDLHPNLDSSNLDVRFYRNRLRVEVIPYLESIQPAFRRTMWRSAEILGEDFTVLESMVNAAWEKCVAEEGNGYLVFSPADLRQQPLAVQRRLFRGGLDRLRPGLRDVDFNVVERAEQLLNRPSGRGRVDLAAGVYLHYEKLWEFGENSWKIKPKEQLWMATWEADLPNVDWPQMPTTGDQRLDVPGELLLEGEWRMVAEIMSDLKADYTEVFENPDPFQAWLDLDRLQLPLIVRARHRGARFHPLGMEGKSIKVADLMINAKLPLRAREKWPLLLSEEEIAWVPGLRIGQNFQINKQTKRVLKVRVID